MGVYIYRNLEGYMKESDDELMQRCKDGDMSAFDIIVQRHKTHIINFVYRFLYDYQTAEDITQKVFIRIYRNIKRYRPDKAGFLVWMYKIASNLCKNELRNRSLHAKVMIAPATSDNDALIDQIEDSSPTLDLNLENNELNYTLSQAISSLPEKFRAVIILRDIQNMSYDEISKIINKPLGTVKSRLNRARLMVKDKVSEYL